MFRGWKTCITYEVAGASSVCIRYVIAPVHILRRVDRIPSELAPNDPARKVDLLDAVLNRLAAWLEKKATSIGSEERKKVLALRSSTIRSFHHLHTAL